MNEQQKTEFFETYNSGIHRFGRIMLIVAIIWMVSVPFAMGAVLGAMPSMPAFGKALAQVALIYLPVAIVEFLIYAPMLGSGASYLTFLTGNVTNMKIPCAVNARDICKTEAGTPENEIVSTLSVAASALTTTVIIAVGVLMMVPLAPVLENPVLTPAFNNVVAALFGALGCKYYVKGFKIAILPFILMSLLCIFVPSVISNVGFLVIPSGMIAIGVSYLLFKKNRL